MGFRFHKAAALSPEGLKTHLFCPNFNSFPNASTRGSGTKSTVSDKHGRHVTKVNLPTVLLCKMAVWLLQCLHGNGQEEEDIPQNFDFFLVVKALATGLGNGLLCRHQ